MFREFVSLGWFCGTVAAMSKCGLRSMSGVFDWCYSELESVLWLLDNDFLGFLEKENLQIRENNERIFDDTKYHMMFSHEVKISFECEFDSIYEKYMRRINRLRKEISIGPICFIRAIRNYNELDYVVNNEEYINSVIKKLNSNNEIVFLIPQYMKVSPSFRLKYYVLKINGYQGLSKIAMRNLFDSNQDFIKWCHNNMDDNRRKDNLIFDLLKENEKLENGYAGTGVEKLYIQRLDEVYKQVRSDEVRIHQLVKIAEVNWDTIELPSAIIIYGAGNIGKLLLSKIQNKCSVECFLDKNPRESSYKGVPILPITEINSVKSSVIIIVPTYDWWNIVEQLEAEAVFNFKMLALEDVLDNNVEW